MKRIENIRKAIYYLCLIFLLFSFPHLNAQNGTWIEQVLQPSMSGQWMADNGECCLGFTKSTSQYIYFFDTKSSQWIEVDLGSSQTFRDLEASGQTIMAYTDEMIIAYSAALSQWDTLSYQGALLNAVGPGVMRSYGCGEKLAYFVTDQYFYVFDSELGAWQSYRYLYPAGTISGNFWSGDNYAGVILHQNPPNYPVNMVYSLPQHAFNKNLQGGYYHDPDWGMTGGFVTNWGDGQGSYILTGYCAQTNQFSPKQLVPPFGTYEGGKCLFPENFTSKTTALFHYMENQSKVHILAYDTWQGHWFEAIHYFDAASITGLGWWHYGGRVAATSQYNNTTVENTYLFFDGATGNFATLTPGIYYRGSISGTPNGTGNFIFAYDTTHIWFYNPANQNSHFANMAGQYPTGFYVGDNFATQGSYPSQGSPARMAIFNADTDNLTIINTGISNGITVEGSPFLCGFTAGATREEVYFYSGIVDAYQTVLFPSGSFPFLNIGNHLALASSSSQSTLYDGTSDALYPLSYHPSTTLIEDDIAVFQKSNNAVDVYSRFLQQVSEFTIAEQINGLQARGALALIVAPGFSKYYAYNGFYNNLVPLQPDGQWQTSLVGEGVAMVIRVDRIYAFDPQAPTAIEPNGNPAVPGTSRLERNYPNPFNPTTTIAFTLPHTSRITLYVYDILGRKVKALVDERKPAGRYTVQWNGTNDTGQPVASGVYLYQLKSSSLGWGKREDVQIHKMLLIK